MGFLDKAKKMAEQAQAKLDEVQKDFNAKQSGGGDQHAGPGNAVEYDQHGRPVTPDTPETPADLPATQSADLSEPKGDPLSAEPAAPTPETPTSPDPAPNKVEGDPLATGEDASRHGRDADREDAPPAPPAPPPPGFSSGDPLAG